MVVGCIWFVGDVVVCLVVFVWCVEYVVGCVGVLGVGGEGCLVGYVYVE